MLARTSPSNRARCITGEKDEAPIHGQASVEEAKALVDEGVQVAPLPFPIAPPEDLN